MKQRSLVRAPAVALFLLALAAGLSTASVPRLILGEYFGSVF